MSDSSEEIRKEKRRDQRVGGAVAEYYIQGEDPKKIKAFIKDLSPRGVCIVIPHEIKVGMVLCLDIYLAGDSAAVMANGRVVWQKVGAYIGFHDVGIEFTEIDDESKKKLAAHY